MAPRNFINGTWRTLYSRVRSIRGLKYLFVFVFFRLLFSFFYVSFDVVDIFVCVVVTERIILRDSDK